MSDLVLKRAWRLADPSIEREAELFWRARDTLVENFNIGERRSQLCAAAYLDGRLAGISTAVPREIPRLRCKLIMYRTLVSGDVRNQQIATKLAVFSRDLLEEWSRENPQEEIQGMGAVIQSRALVENVPVPVYPDTKLSLFGYTNEGFQMRVYWFAHARISTYWPGDPDGDTRRDRQDESKASQ
jgi:hypothetical protein